jgi:hypothetical protein
MGGIEPEKNGNTSDEKETNLKLPVLILSDMNEFWY